MEHRVVHPLVLWLLREADHRYVPLPGAGGRQGAFRVPGSIAVREVQRGAQVSGRGKIGFASSILNTIVAQRHG